MQLDLYFKTLKMRNYVTKRKINYLL